MSSDLSMKKAAGSVGKAPEAFSTGDPEFIKCPFPHYEWMLDEKPIWYDAAIGAYIISRYEDVRAVATDPVTFSNRASQVFNRTSPVQDQVRAMYEKDGWVPMDTLVTNDGSEHKHFRSLVDKAFTHKRVQSIQPMIDELVDKLVDNMLIAGKADFNHDYAVPLSMTVVATQVGLDSADMRQLRLWTDLILEQINPVLAPEREIEITRELIVMQKYLDKVIEYYRVEPCPTIFSDLVHAEIDGKKLAKRELMNLATQIFAGGNETTAAGLNNTIHYLARHPELANQLYKEPEKIPLFVEEMLRTAAPIQRIFRKATRDVEVHGQMIPKDSLVIIQWGSANRDPRKFACPANVELDRSNSGQHLAFGVGSHFCVGNKLARAEIATTVSAIVSRCEIELANGEDSVEYYPQFSNLAIKRLDLKVKPRGSV